MSILALCDSDMDCSSKVLNLEFQQSMDMLSAIKSLSLIYDVVSKKKGLRASQKRRIKKLYKSLYNHPNRINNQYYTPETILKVRKFFTTNKRQIINLVKGDKREVHKKIVKSVVNLIENTSSWQDQLFSSSPTKLSKKELDLLKFWQLLTPEHIRLISRGKFEDANKSLLNHLEQSQKSIRFRLADRILSLIKINHMISNINK